MSDVELLEEYVRDRSETAFATLVERHVNLVYSAARRQVGSPHLAEDVAQAVFVELSRHAARIPPAQPLAAWLYVVTRRTAIDAVRRESRRLARETTAAEIAAMKTPPEAWSKVEDTIDEAMTTLNDTERAAVVLRFFQNLSLREVGVELGISEDTAQKRVSRALDRLRTFFIARGIAVTAAGLATDLSAHALQTAPVGLAAAISHAAALSSVTSTAALETSRVIVMTTLQKSLAVTAFLVVGSAGLYESLLVARQTDDLRVAQDQNGRTAAEIRALRAAGEAAAARLKSVEQQIDTRLAQAPAPDPADAALVVQMTGWLTRMDRIRQIFTQRPELSIPELQHLKEENWFTIAGGKSLETDEDVRKVAAELRKAAEAIFLPRISAALRAYVTAHNGTLPASPQELASLADPPIDRAILDRYEMLQHGKVEELPAADRRKIMAARTPPDPELDSYTYIYPTGYGGSGASWINVNEAMEGFAKANPGQRATSAAQLRAFLKWPMSDEVVQKNLNRLQGVPP